MHFVRPAPRMRTRALSATALAALFLGGPMANSAQAIATVPPLGTAAAFSVLAGATVTNTGITTIERSVGVSPGTAITGASTITLTGDGTYHQADAVAGQAQVDLTAAFNQAAGQTDDPPKATDDELGGETLVGGVYNRPAAMALNGELTLDGGNEDGTASDSVWVFQAGTTLITGSSASITLTGGANACNVFWQVGSSATIGTGTLFAGTIMADQSIALQTGARLDGRALARIGEVTLDNNVINSAGCNDDVDVEDGTDTPTGTPTTGPTPTDGPTGGPGGGGGAGDDDDNGNGGNGNGNGGNGNGNGNGNGGNNGGPGGGGGAGDDGVQVTEIPEGAVDTGQTGEATGPNRAVLTGSALAAGAGALALVAVRRRRSM